RAVWRRRRPLAALLDLRDVAVGADRVLGRFDLCSELCRIRRNRRWPPGPALCGIGGPSPESGRLDGFLVLRFPRRRLWAQADDDLVLPDVPDPDADHLPVGEGYPCVAVRLRRVWIFHPRRFFV